MASDCEHVCVYVTCTIRARSVAGALIVWKGGKKRSVDRGDNLQSQGRRCEGHREGEGAGKYTGTADYLQLVMS